MSYDHLADSGSIRIMPTTSTWDFLTLDEVAAILRIGKRTAYDLARKGQLGGATKVGGSWRILRDEFDQWVRQGGGASASRRGIQNQG